MFQSQYHVATIFSVPVRWAVRVLAWLAFFVASYLAWHAATGSAVAGCGVGSEAGCDFVLTSSWSKWLNVPVSLAGLACYASLAGFSALVGLTGPRESRWIDTLVILLATVAAGASIWFLALQAFVVGHFCPYCIVVDSCGIALGALAIWSVLRGPVAATPAPLAGGTMALKVVMPGMPRIVPLNVTPSTTRPAIGIAFGGAAVLLCALIVGQVIWPSRTYQRGTLALVNQINMNDDNEASAASDSDVTPTAQRHVAMRPVDSDSNADSGDGKSTAVQSEKSSADTHDSKSKPTDDDPAEPTSKKRSRIVKFLGGKLTLDTYQQPILGDPEAPHVMVEMVSYDCPHCRKMHETVQRGLRRYGKQLAVLILPVPLEMKCNRLVTDPKASHAGACTTARMALAVADIKPAAFRAFHDFLMEDVDKPPTQAKSVAKAYGMVDSSKLRALTGGETLNKQIAKNVDLYATLQQQHAEDKSFGLPIQILGDEILSGSVENAEDVYKAWEENLGVKQ